MIEALRDDIGVCLPEQFDIGLEVSTVSKIRHEEVAVEPPTEHLSVTLKCVDELLRERFGLRVDLHVVISIDMVVVTLVVISGLFGINGVTVAETASETTE